MLQLRALLLFKKHRIGTFETLKDAEFELNRFNLDCMNFVRAPKRNLPQYICQDQRNGKYFLNKKPKKDLPLRGFETLKEAEEALKRWQETE